MRTLKTIVAFAALLLASSAFAQGVKGTGTYGAAGCGLGSLAFGNQPGGVQILASTTNGTFGNQTFGITSGTSNCQPGLMAQGTKDFVEANREVLAKDAARGEGEAVGAIAVINRCRDVRAVGAALQREFRTIFPSEQASSDDVTQAILRTLHSDPALGCGQS
jgi:hypothetical protein